MSFVNAGVDDEFLATILPEQIANHSRQLLPEQVLLVEILHRAMCDLRMMPVLEKDNMPRFYADARRWCLSNNRGPHSFIWCCEGVGISASLLADYVRRTFPEPTSVRLARRSYVPREADGLPEQMTCVRCGDRFARPTGRNGRRITWEVRKVCSGCAGVGAGHLDKKCQSVAR